MPIPLNNVAEFDYVFQQQIGDLNDYQTVSFYSDFTRFMGNYLLTPSMHEQVRQFFQIRPVTDMTSDLLCLRAI